jgi:hypothetical protein
LLKAEKIAKIWGMSEKQPGILAIRRKSADSDRLEAIIAEAKPGVGVVAVDLGLYKTSIKAQKVIAELGSRDHFDGRTAEAMWVPNIGKIRRMLSAP